MSLDAILCQQISNLGKDDINAVLDNAEPEECEQEAEASSENWLDYSDEDKK